MTESMYRYIFIGAAVLCGIMLVVSILLFILLKIPKVISDLSGATARKAIKNIRKQNEASGDKGYQVSAFNQQRGKLTDKISPSGNVIQQQQSQMAGINTTKIATQELPQQETANQTTVLSNETSVLDNLGAGETSVLSEEMHIGETSVLSEEMPIGETSVLSEPVAAGQTTVLSKTVDLDDTAVITEQSFDTAFVIEYEITYVHSNEAIS